MGIRVDRVRLGGPHLEVSRTIPCKVEGDHSIGSHEVKANAASLQCSSVKRSGFDGGTLALSDRSKTLMLLSVLNVSSALTRSR
jgi:hypothetical protein